RTRFLGRSDRPQGDFCLARGGRGVGSAAPTSAEWHQLREALVASLLLSAGSRLLWRRMRLLWIGHPRLLAWLWQRLRALGPRSLRQV
ncbi:unnamed protein product, partial [Polarella glacialis]